MELLLTSCPEDRLLEQLTESWYSLKTLGTNETIGARPNSPGEGDLSMIVLLKAIPLVCLVLGGFAVGIGIKGLLQGGEAAVIGAMLPGGAAVLLSLLYLIRRKLRALLLARLEESEGPTC